MSQIVNLKHVRKALEQTEDRAKANANAAKFGQNKAERVLNAARQSQARKKLDAHHLYEE
jgi:hypothetical protein